MGIWLSNSCPQNCFSSLLCFFSMSHLNLTASNVAIKSIRRFSSFPSNSIVFFFLLILVKLQNWLWNDNNTHITRNQVKKLSPGLSQFSSGVGEDPETLPSVFSGAYPSILSHKSGCGEQMWLRQAWPGLSVTAANLIVYTQDHIAAAVAHKKLIAESRHEVSQEQLICVPGLCQSTKRPCPSTLRDSLIYPVISPSHRCDSFSCCCVSFSL